MRYDIYIYIVRQLRVKQLLTEDTSHHISQLHVSAHIYGTIFTLSFLKKVLYTIDITKYYQFYTITF